MEANSRRALIKLLASSAALAVLAASCFTSIYGGFVGVVWAAIALVLLPAVIWFSVEASWAIQREHSPSKFFKTMGVVLGLPFLGIGVAAISIGTVFSFVEIIAIFTNLFADRSAIKPVVFLGEALLLLVFGYVSLRKWYFDNVRRRGAN